MGRARLLLTLLGIVLIVAPLKVAADASPEATPTAACAFPPISTDLLREIRDDATAHPIPTPTVPERGTWSSQLHRMPFPPPSGDPIDDQTLTSVQQFLADYADCLDSGDILAVYGAWTDEFLRLAVGQRPQTIDPLIEAIEMSPVVFARPGLDLLLLRAWQIDSGHVVAVVQIVPEPQYWTLYLRPVGDSWRIDDIWPLGERAIGDNLTGPIYGTPISGQ